MPAWLKQSTAVDIALGPFVDATDGVTPMTALTISQADVRLKKNAGNWAQVNDATSATHEENGWYEKELDATDTNTLGILIVAVNESGALPVWREFMVVPANVYESLIGNTEYLETAGGAQEFDLTTSPVEFYKKDGTTVQFTRMVATDVAAPPIVGVS